MQRFNIGKSMHKPSKRERTYHLFRFIDSSWLIIMIGLFVGLTIGGCSSSSESSDVHTQKQAISLALPESLAPIFRDVALPRFHEANPDLHIELRTISGEIYQDLQLPTSEDMLDSYLEATNQLVSQADVHLTLPFSIGPETTRAGYFLDMQPLIASDANLQTQDFLPTLRNAFLWDGGQWALPVLVTPLVVIYDPSAFDAVGLTYPSESWTFEDFANAARLLAGEGSPGMQVASTDLPTFFHILTGQGFTNGDSPSQPNFDVPELINLVEQWNTLESESVVTSGFVEHVPLRFGRIYDLVDRNLRGSLLLNSQSGADVIGVAISSGTNNPQAAYRLAVYMTTVPELASLTPTSLSARYSIQTEYGDTQWQLPEEAHALSQQTLEHMLTPADIQFGQYLQQAFTLINSGEQPDVALQNAQVQAIRNLTRAEVIQETLQVQVPPASLPLVQEGVTLQFALFTGSTELPNRAQWEDVIAEFVNNDPSVNSIKLNFIMPSANYPDEILRNDCVFGYDYTNYPNETLLSLDPLLNADTTFDPADVIGDVMLEMQREGNTYAIPAAVLPYVLRYDREHFAQAGIPEPDGTWTRDEFIDALHQLDTLTEGAPLFLNLNYSTPWELLMAAYGIAPVDYTTSPPTLRLTDTNVVSVVQQVLDLAKSGHIEYAPMATFFGSGSLPTYSPPLMTEQLRDVNSADELEGYGLVTFPIGAETTPISFYTTSGFIFAHAPHPEACYRWLREITRHPELFSGMPAYHSVINDQATLIIYGERSISTFERFADLMEADNRIFIRSFGLGVGDAMFMARAFDRYVLEDADLETELALAQELTTDYRTCISSEDKDVVDCLLETDPTIRENIPPQVLGNR